MFGREPRTDFSDQIHQPGIREDPSRIYGGCSFDLDGQILGLRPVGAAGDRFRSTRVGLDHLSFLVDSVQDLQAARARLAEAGIAHGEVIELPDFGLAILSLQDPDDINLELTARLG